MKSLECKHLRCEECHDPNCEHDCHKIDPRKVIAGVM